MSKFWKCPKCGTHNAEIPGTPGKRIKCEHCALITSKVDVAYISDAAEDAPPVALQMIGAVAVVAAAILFFNVLGKFL